MKKTLSLAIAYLFLNSTSCFSQDWQLSTEALKYPVKVGEGESSMGWINKYDTIKCKIKIKGIEEIKDGFKIVYRYNGYWIDDHSTLNIFVDDKKNRIKNVSAYYFN